MNDERPIEKLLRRYAKKRRDAAGVPVVLHPATRRLLQGEVARQFRKAARDGAQPSFAARLKGWRLHLAWAVPLLLLVGIGLWSLIDRPEAKRLALGPTPKRATADRGSRAATAVEIAPAESSTVKAEPPSPAAAPTQSLNQPAPGLAGAGTAGKSRSAEPAVALGGAAEQKGDAARDGTKEAERADKLDIVSSAAPARLAKASGAVTPLRETPNLSTNLAPTDDLDRTQTQTYSQSFANQIPESLKEKAAPIISPILANFRVEQTGRQLRVVDSDGSTYFGETDAAPGVGGAGGGQKNQAVQLFKRDGKLNPLPVAASVQPSPMQSNFYRVTGTNRTLNQTVEFTWSFVEQTNTPVVAQSGSSSGEERNKDAKKLLMQFPVQLQNSFITGRAQFGPGQEIEINAAPVSP